MNCLFLQLTGAPGVKDEYAMKKDERTFTDKFVLF